MRTFTILKTILISVLTLFLFNNVSFAQGTTLFQNFEAGVWAGTNYTLRTVTDDFGPWSVTGVGTMADGDRFRDARSVRLRGNSGDNCYIQMGFDKQDGIGEVSFYYASFSTHSGGIIVLYYSIDGGVNWVSAGSATAPAWSGEMVQATFTLNIEGNARIKIVREGSLSNGTTVNIDDLYITDYICENCVKAPAFNPPGGTHTSAVDVTITSATEGATIRYTLNGDDPTEESEQYSTPITISTQTTLKAKAWKEGMEPSIVNAATYIFPQSVSTLAELRALAPEYNGAQVHGSTVYIYSGQAVVTHIQEFNSVKYIQDATAAIMIFDPPGKITGNVAVGDRLTNISGTLSNYFGMLQIAPTENCQNAGYFYTVPITHITLSDLDYDYNNPIQAKVVRADDVLYMHSGNFARGTYYSLKQNNVDYDSVVYTDKYEATYIGQAIPTYMTRIIGICNFKGSTGIPTRNRIIPMDDLSAVLKITNINQSAIKLAPNPANSFVNIITGTPMKLEVYSLLGTLIYTESLSEGTSTISVSNYPPGVYVMKLTDTRTGKSSMQKLVVK